MTFFKKKLIKVGEVIFCVFYCELKIIDKVYKMFLYRLVENH